MSEASEREFKQKLNSLRRTKTVAWVALVIAFLALVAATSFSVIASDDGSANQSPTPCPTATSGSPGPAGSPGPTGAPGATGAAGLSAYDLWRKLGNKGDAQDFLNSLVGEKGEDGYVGASGINSEPGADGKSAYQLWLDAGNTGTSDEFLASLVGPEGAQGIGGLSAYEIWKAIGNTGSEADFIATLQGAAGQAGTPGDEGKSAYQIWLDLGNSGTEADFISSLQGAQGDAGICTNGTNGKSAYQVWLDEGNIGSVEVYLASLKGDRGATGEAGASGTDGKDGVDGVDGKDGPRGPAGPQGPAGVAGGYYLAAQDKTIQTAADSGQTYALKIGTNDGSNGVTLDNSNPAHSIIRFEHDGVYNIQYSAQWSNSDVNKEYDTNVWIKVNGNDVPDSSTYSTVGQKHSGRNGTLVTAVNYVLTFNSGDTLEFYWWAEDTSVVLGTIPGATNPVMPESPGIIMTVTQVG